MPPHNVRLSNGYIYYRYALLAKLLEPGEWLDAQANVFAGADRGDNSVRCTFLIESFDQKYCDHMGKVKETLAKVSSSSAATAGADGEEEVVYDSDEEDGTAVSADKMIIHTCVYLRT